MFAAGGSANNNSILINNWNLTNTLSYKKSFGEKNNLSLLELAAPKDIELKDMIAELITQFYAADMPVYDIIEKCGLYINNNFKK